MGYGISAFKPEVQKIIRENNFDTDASNTIDSTEMTNLIFCTNANSEKELLVGQEPIWDAKKDDFICSGLTGAMTAALAHGAYHFFRYCGKPGRIVGAVLSALTLFAGGTTAYLLKRDPIEKEIYLEHANFEANRHPLSPNYQEDSQKLIKGLGLAENTQFVEYKPNKGEYWTSILKAKYNVDDTTAQAMTNKIKNAIYDDPKAAKQPPIMYLPKTWDFNDNTYNFQEDAFVETTNTFSEDVKTEMGKMNKNIVL